MGKRLLLRIGIAVQVDLARGGDVARARCWPEHHRHAKGGAHASAYLGRAAARVDKRVQVEVLPVAGREEKKALLPRQMNLGALEERKRGRKQCGWAKT